MIPILIVLGVVLVVASLPVAVMYNSLVAIRNRCINVRENNNKVQQVPSNIVAKMFNFGPRDHFELGIPEARNPVNVQF